MADWVLKGSIKGPQGDPGADAQLPEGGTTGDFLQKNADGTGWFNSEGLLRASYIGNLQQLGDAGQSLEIHNVSVTSNGYVAGASTDNPPEDGAFVYADDKNSPHLGHNRVGVLNGIPYVDLDTTDATGENGHLAADGRYSYVDDIEAADAAEEQGEALTIPTGAAVKQYVEAHAGDALPEGGTTGQVLTKTADGEAWADAPEPDMTGVVKRESNGSLNVANFTLGEFGVGSYANFSYSGGGNITLTSAAGYASFIAKTSDGYVAEFGAAYDNSPYLKMGSKIVHSITDDASGGAADALATAKAVKDYVDANAGGGGGLELLWEGNGSSNFSIELDNSISYYSALLFSYMDGYLTAIMSALVPVSILAGVAECPAGYSPQYGGHSIAVTAANGIEGSVIDVIPQADCVIVEMYGLKASGGGVAPEGIVLFEGMAVTKLESNETNYDLSPYSKIEVTMGTGDTETFTGPFPDAGTYNSLPNDHCFLEADKSGWILTAYPYSFSKVTAYK